MKWSEKTWGEVTPILERTIEHPFVQDLMNGTLDRSRFTHYIHQDALYLADYGRMLTGIATKLPNARHAEAFVRFASDSIAVERALHQSFLQEFGSSGKYQPSPSCLLYTSYLLRQLVSAPVEVVAAAVLPCFWVYKEVGDYILANQSKENNPYQAWIDTYGGEEFAQSVSEAIAICDDLADACTPEQQRAMTDAFIMCTKMEWMFWDSAYNHEGWKI